MSFPLHALLQFGGPLFDNEIWSCGVRLSITTAGGTEDPQDFANAQLAHAVTSVQHLITNWSASSAAKLEFVKLNAIGADGRYTDRSHTNEQHFTGTLQSSGRTNMHPSEVALCVTHTTALLRGPAHAGRMFVPSPVYGVDAGTGAITIANAQEAADAHVAFLAELNDWPGTDPLEGWEASVVSRVGLGSVNKITGVKVGRVLDVIRTRRNKQLENYVVGAGSVG